MASDFGPDTAPFAAKACADAAKGSVMIQPDPAQG
jgi:hypothetical protein